MSKIIFHLGIQSGVIRITNNIEQLLVENAEQILSSVIPNSSENSSSFSVNTMNTLQFKEFVENFYPSIIGQRLFKDLEKKRLKMVDILNQNLTQVKNGFYNGVNSVRMNCRKSNFDKSLYYYEMQDRFENELLFWENQCQLICCGLIKSTLENYQRNGFESPEISRKRNFVPISSQKILYDWMLENYRNPYPNKKQKQDLIQKTGLTEKQTNNWLINNRLRMWKPIMQKFKKDC